MLSSISTTATKKDKKFAIRFKSQKQSKGLSLLRELFQVWITAVPHVDVGVTGRPAHAILYTHDYRLFTLFNEIQIKRNLRQTN